MSQRVIILHGTSGVGKTTLARAVASSIPHSHLLSSDVIRAVVRSCDMQRQLPIHSHSYAVPDHDGQAPSSPIRIIDGYRRQCAALEPALLSALLRLLDEGGDIVAEGVHFAGSRIPDELTALGIIPHEVVLHVPDEEEHHARLQRRADVRGRVFLPSNFTRIRTVQTHLLDHARANALLIMDTTSVAHDHAADLLLQLDGHTPAVHARTLPGAAPNDTISV